MVWTGSKEQKNQFGSQWDCCQSCKFRTGGASGIADGDSEGPVISYAHSHFTKASESCVPWDTQDPMQHSFAFRCDSLREEWNERERPVEYSHGILVMKATHKDSLLLFINIKCAIIHCLIITQIALIPEAEFQINDPSKCQPLDDLQSVDADIPCTILIWSNTFKFIGFCFARHLKHDSSFQHKSSWQCKFRLHPQSWSMIIVTCRGSYSPAIPCLTTCNGTKTSVSCQA